MSDVRQWLVGLGLEEYAQAFEVERIELDDLVKLDAADLKELGLPMGPRKRVIAAIRALDIDSRESMESNAKEPAEGKFTRTISEPQAERRQLTVMFCDLVGSTQLSQELDPEELRRLIHTYQDACAGAVARYEGHVAQFLGDGVLVYFGYPKAHEGEAERAIRAGLDIVERIGDVAAGHKLQVRIGIDTGLVVIGQGETLEEQDRTAIGDAPNVAARLQSLAEPGSIMISERTRQLSRGTFEYADCGTHSLKGIALPLQAWRIDGQRNVDTRFDAATGGRMAPMIGRDMELNAALQKWEQAKQGATQVLLLTGEAGIGKSRILRALRDQLVEKGTRAWQFQCSPYYSKTALYPITSHFERLLRFERDEPQESRLSRLQSMMRQRFSSPDVDINLIGHLLNLPVEKRYGPLAMSPQKQKSETIRCLIDMVECAGREQPVLLMYEDLHWADPTTLELIEQMILRKSIHGLIVLTYRPEYAPAWIEQSNVTTLTLSRLDAGQTTRVINRVAGGRKLPQNVVDQIVQKTDGIPLFVEELTQTVLESPLLVDRSGNLEIAGKLAPLAIPTTLHDSLMARLDRLTPVKEIVQVGACLGREFTHEVLQLALPIKKENLDNAVSRLLESELVFRRGANDDATYVFKHALVQDAAYESMLKSKRAELHARIANVLQQHFPELAANQPEVLAHHYTSAGLNSDAIPYWMSAATVAFRRSALAESAAHANQGLKIVLSMQESRERDVLESRFQTLLGNVYTQLLGLAAHETESAFARAAVLCRAEPDPVTRMVALWGGWLVQEMSGKNVVALQTAEQMVRLAKTDRRASLVAHTALMDSLYWVGRYEEANTEFQRSMEMYRESSDTDLLKTFSFDMRVVGLLYASHFLWMLGYPDQALECKKRMDAWEQALSFPFMTAFCKTWGARIFELRGDWKAMRLQLEQAALLSDTYGFAWWTCHVNVWRGWMSVHTGNVDEGVRMLKDGVTGFESAGSDIRAILQPYLAMALSRANRQDESLDTIDVSIEAAKETGFNCSRAELERMRGEILLSFDVPREDEAEASFRKAILIAKEQNAKGWELRASLSHARLMQSKGRQRDALALLKPVYDWFTEGFDTKDLKEAKALLEELESMS